MFIFGFGVYQNVINVDHDELVKILHENSVHQTHERSWSIGKTKEHNGVLVKTITSCKGCFRNVLLSDLGLMVS